MTHFKADGLTNKLSTHFGNVPIPSRMLNLRRLNSGLPIPKFATWEEDKPNLTVMNRDFFGTALRNKLCWICGQKMGRFASFVGGPKSTASKCFVDPPPATRDAPTGESMSITHIAFSSQNWAEKHHKGFDKIVSVYEQGARRPRFGNRSPGSILYKNIPDQDFYFQPEASYPSTQDITSFLLFCTSASPKSILIHCKMGVARSAALAAILLAYLQPNISTETIFRSLPNYRAGRPNDVYPTRTLLAPAQEAIQRPDLLSNAYRAFKSDIGYDRVKLHAHLAGLPPIETANLLSRRIKENPGLAPFFVSQRYIAETSS